MILRDSHGVAQVRYVTGNKILRILKAKGTITLVLPAGFKVPLSIAAQYYYVPVSVMHKCLTMNLFMFLLQGQSTQK